MKKTIGYLGLALVMATTAVSASDFNVSHTAVSEMYDSKPLCAAISKGDLEAVKIMIEYGADVNETTTRGMTPLMYAAMYNNTGIMNLLIEKGADLEKEDYQGLTALDHAKRSNSNEAAQLLTKAMKKK
ncbi:ankyrin repeat domain-containing protein [Flavobacterium sediminis]|uniref:Ankyrin repeat domain-containing protein n=1 Tax=Flavobacterium sediminis TaxID=2201181 RepID=A0A2U8QX60_9FLAO|nr:ankyrin repeat domain-containing protein [Flavobacterium sediminis]AWM14758.1 ankyrin repeat domain-containing protein [Flavobacterium sediminis]